MDRIVNDCVDRRDGGAWDLGMISRDFRQKNPHYCADECRVVALAKKN